MEGRETRWKTRPAWNEFQTRIIFRRQTPGQHHFAPTKEECGMNRCMISRCGHNVRWLTAASRRYTSSTSTSTSSSCDLQENSSSIRNHLPPSRQPLQMSTALYQTGPRQTILRMEMHSGQMMAANLNPNRPNDEHSLCHRSWTPSSSQPDRSPICPRLDQARLSQSSSKS